VPWPVALTTPIGNRPQVHPGHPVLELKGILLPSILNLKHARFDMQHLLLVLLVHDCKPCMSFSKTAGGDWRNPYSYVSVQVHVRGRVRQSTVQCTIYGGEGGRDGEFKRNEEVRGEASLGNSKLFLHG
jgi:hypothetical protein